VRRFVRSVQQGERSKHGVGRVARAGRDPSGPDSISYRGHKARCQAADGANGLADCSRTRGHARSGPRRQRAAGPRRPRTRACVGRRSSRSDAVARGKEQLHHGRSCRRVSKPRATRRRTAASRRLDAPRQDRLETGRARRVLVARSDCRTAAYCAMRCRRPSVVGAEDRPADLGVPVAGVGRLGHAAEVVLAEGGVDADLVLHHVGAELAVREIDVAR